MYLLQRLQGVRVYFSDEVGFRHGVKVLTNREDVHQAVVCDLNTLEVREKPGEKNDIFQKASCQWWKMRKEPRGQYIMMDRDKIEFEFCSDSPGENVLAGIRIRKRTELSDHHTLLCDGAHIRICFDKPDTEEGLNIFIYSVQLESLK